MEKQTIKTLNHLTKILEMCSGLKKTGTLQSEEEKVNYLLLSMSKSYENIVIALETLGKLKWNRYCERQITGRGGKERNSEM